MLWIHSTVFNWGKVRKGCLIPKMFFYHRPVQVVFATVAHPPEAISQHSHYIFCFRIRHFFHRINNTYSHDRKVPLKS